MHQPWHQPSPALAYMDYSWYRQPICTKVFPPEPGPLHHSKCFYSGTFVYLRQHAGHQHIVWPLLRALYPRLQLQGVLLGHLRTT